MFYVKDKIIEYPHKSILEDVMSRDGEPTEECFTPYYGCAHIVREQMLLNRNEFELSDIIRSAVSDYNPHKQRPTEDGVHRLVSANEVKDYYTNLEDISQEWIEKYVAWVVIGFKVNKDGMKEKLNDRKPTMYFYDEEEGVSIAESDIIEKDIPFTTQEVLEAKTKLPYLLKQLHIGSIEYRASLLSFIIAAEKCFRENDYSTNYYLVPRDLIAKGVYKMNGNGDIDGKFVISDNSGERLRSSIAWVCGKHSNSLYYKAYRELLKVLSILEIDITKENALEYDRRYIDKIVCTYLASNEEYIETYGFADKKILDMLEPNQLFSVAKIVSENNVEPVRLTVNTVADNIATNTECLKYKYPQIWKDDIESVNKFLAYYQQYILGKKTFKQIENYEVEKGILKRYDGFYEVFNVTKIVSSKCETEAVLSISGKLIIIENFSMQIKYLDVRKAISMFKGEINDNRWDYISI